MLLTHLRLNTTFTRRTRQRSLLAFKDAVSFGYRGAFERKLIAHYFPAPKIKVPDVVLWNLQASHHHEYTALLQLRKETFLFSKWPRQEIGYIQPSTEWIKVSFRGRSSGRVVKCTTHLHFVLRSGMRGSISPHRVPYWCGV